MRERYLAILTCSILLAQPSLSAAAELAMLSPETWDSFACQGKEADGIYGDYVLRNDQITVVIARPTKGRNANMTVRETGGMIIDLTRRERSNDQLSALYAGGPSLGELRETVIAFGDDARMRSVARQGVYDLQEVLRSRRIRIEFIVSQQSDVPLTAVAYELADGEPYVTVTTRVANTGQTEAEIPSRDALRADRTFAFGNDAGSQLFWAYDEWFRQGYGIVVPSHQASHSGQRSIVIEYAHESDAPAVLAPGETMALKRYVFPADDLLQVRAVAQRLAGVATRAVHVRVHDVSGPVGNARITVSTDQQTYGIGRTAEDGTLALDLPKGDYTMQVEALGRPARTREINASTASVLEVELEPCGYIVASIKGANGNPIPCKVAFYGREGTEDPYFGPDSGAVEIQNLRYSHDGSFRQEVAPGKYDVIVSYGPEFNVVSTQLEVTRGKETTLEATLERTVDTRGWISSDFHSHSSPSGDNTSSQLGRVLNLLCEHIEFAPCTEHNRLSTYVPHLEHLGVEHLLATCVGLELTGQPGSVNHQNAFPLIRTPRIQDGGAPLTDENPVVQIQRLALWDSGSDKLVQTNHPTIPQILGDRDLNTEADDGFREMFGFMDAIEVHPPEAIFSRPASLEEAYRRRNAMFHWMQLLNVGYRITGVVNTDAHYNFHGSGGLRNYIKCSTDDPAQIDTMEIVHAAEAGHIVMTNGPFMEVSLKAGPESGGAPATASAIPGDEIVAKDGRATLHVRIQCANWLDINRVQVFLNGRPRSELNFTRRTTPSRFSDDVVKFDAEIPLELTADTHVIAAAAGENLTLGRVMGSNWGEKMPVAVSNPIYVDVDGGGFQHNGDMLDLPLPDARP